MYEKTYRKKYANLLNYLGIGIEYNLSKKLTLISRIHHRSGIFGFFSNVHGGSNGYLIGFCYKKNT